MTPFSKTLVASLFVAGASLFFALFVSIGFPYLALVAVWIATVARAIWRFGVRGVWLLVAAPVVLPPAFVSVAVPVCFTFHLNCVFP